MNTLIPATVIYFILLGLAIFTNRGISKMNETYDKGNEEYLNRK